MGRVPRRVQAVPIAIRSNLAVLCILADGLFDDMSNIVVARFENDQSRGVLMNTKLARLVVCDLTLPFNKSVFESIKYHDSDHLPD